MMWLTPVSDQISPSDSFRQGEYIFSSDISPCFLQTRYHTKQGMKTGFNFQVFHRSFYDKIMGGNTILALPRYERTLVRNVRSLRLPWRRASAGHWHYGTFWLQLSGAAASISPCYCSAPSTGYTINSETNHWAVEVIHQDLCPFNCFLLNGYSDEPAAVQSSGCHLLSACQRGFFTHLPPAALQLYHRARISKWFQLLGGDPRSTEYSPDQNHAHFLPCAPADTFLNEYCCVCWSFYGLFTSWACNIVRVMLFLISWKNYCFRRLNAFASKGSL